MSEHSLQPHVRQLSAIHCGLLLGVLIVPVYALTRLQPLLPSWVVQGGFLMLLPVAAGSAYWMSRSFGGARELGIVRPVSWLRSVAVGIGAGLGMILVARTVINPLTAAAFGRLVDPAAFDALEGQLTALLINVVLISWMHAALCEEIVFRGFFLRWVERLLGGGSTGLVVAVVVQALLFGSSHYPQGLPGITATTLGGVLWGAIFVASGRQLWIVIVGHATFDTVLYVLVYFGQQRLFLPG